MHICSDPGIDAETSSIVVAQATTASPRQAGNLTTYLNNYQQHDDCLLI